MEKQKRALAIHDISCVGKCSLTVALPILSAAGIACCCLPTAVLSTHTGGFEGYTYRDLTKDIMPIAEHWKRLGLSFDAFYTGYLGSPEQIDLMIQLFDMFDGNDTIRLIDPVMADYGVLYPGFAKDFPQQMKRLCARADVIIPNVTEATLLLGFPYRDGPFEASYVEELLARLAELGPKKVVLTGVSLDKEHLGTAAWDDGKVTYAFAEHVNGQYHGTGDVWGSAFLAALLCGRNLHDACQTACDFTTASVRYTLQQKTDVRYGVRFEAALPGLMRSLGLA
jgi:Pyridoxal/pyridoxine/pyridoxamine kinase